MFILKKPLGPVWAIRVSWLKQFHLFICGTGTLACAFTSPEAEPESWGTARGSPKAILAFWSGDRPRLCSFHSCAQERNSLPFSCSRIYRAKTQRIRGRKQQI